MSIEITKSSTFSSKYLKTSIIDILRINVFLRSTLMLKVIECQPTLNKLN